MGFSSHSWSSSSLPQRNVMPPLEDSCKVCCYISRLWRPNVLVYSSHQTFQSCKYNLLHNLRFAYTVSEKELADEVLLLPYCQYFQALRSRCCSWQLPPKLPISLSFSSLSHIVLFHTSSAPPIVKVKQRVVFLQY